MENNKEYFVSIVIKKDNDIKFMNAITPVNKEITEPIIRALEYDIKDHYRADYATIYNIVPLSFINGDINNDDETYKNKWNNLKSFLESEIDSDRNKSYKKAIQHMLNIMNIV